MGSIGAWFYFLRLMSNIAIVTNLALLLFTSTLFEAYSTSTKWVTFLIAEHAALALTFLVESWIPDIPESVTNLMNRHRYIEDKVFNGKGAVDESESTAIDVMFVGERAEKLDLIIHPHPCTTSSE